MHEAIYAVREVADNGVVVLTIYPRKEDAPPEAVPLVNHNITDEQSCELESSIA